MTKNNFLSLFIFTALLPIFAFAQNAPEQAGSSVAIIQALNKTTAKTSILEAKIGQKINFGQLTITARKCWQAPLDQKPESKILLEVFEDKNDGNPAKRIFYGWLFASSPSVSGLEHPIYDLAALGCKSR